MKICIIGIQGEDLDEGIKNFGLQITRHIGNSDKVRYVDIHEALRPTIQKSIYRFDPDVIHLIPGPSWKGILMLEYLGTLTGASTVATALQMKFPDRARWAAKRTRLDVLLIQSSKQQRAFEGLERTLKRVPSGVDVDRFYPIGKEKNRSLRKKYGLPQDEFLFLHVGHFKEGRGLLELRTLTEHGEVLIVGSPSTGQDSTVKSELERSGCRLIDEYIESISELYQLADCYVFPVKDESHSIQFPLSVLEAMSCNLPILSTRFGALPDWISEGNGVCFTDDFSQVDDAVIDFETVNTRSKAKPYSWEQVVERIQAVYREICHQ